MIPLIVFMTILIGDNTMMPWTQPLDLEPVFEPATCTQAWTLEISPNEALQDRHDRTVSLALPVTVHTFLEDDVESEVDVHVTLSTPAGDQTEELFLLAGEKETVTLSTLLFTDCDRRHDCSERVRIAVQSSADVWVGAEVHGVFEAEVASKVLYEAEARVVVVEAP